MPERYEVYTWSSASMEDTGELLIIHEVEKNKALYNKRHALYKNRLKKSYIWKDIGTETDKLINIIGTRFRCGVTALSRASFCFRSRSHSQIRSRL